MSTKNCFNLNKLRDMGNMTINYLLFIFTLYPIMKY